jgi:hypothetical protein
MSHCLSGFGKTKAPLLTSKVLDLVKNKYVTELFKNYVCTRWGYHVALTRILTIYQIFHPPFSFIAPSPHSWDSFNMLLQNFISNYSALGNVPQ